MWVVYSEDMELYGNRQIARKDESTMHYDLSVCCRIYVVDSSVGANYQLSKQFKI